MHPRPSLALRFYVAVAVLALPALLGAANDYFPPPDDQGGWRIPAGRPEAIRVASVDPAKLGDAFDYIQKLTKHGGLLVVRNGWLVYERYFGRAHRDANPNNASIGKSFTSVAVGILMGERSDLFSEGLGTKVFTPVYLPSKALALADPGRAKIRLGQLLTMTAGIRGNNPGSVEHRKVRLDPEGPDGWEAMTDEMALGKRDGPRNTKTLWCKPGAGYSYATSSSHVASMVLRHVAGMELQDYVAQKIAQPLGWGRWGWGYKNRIVDHTPGGGGIAPRPTDMMRFLYMMLRDGRWGTRQVVPEDYVQMCGRLSPYNPHADYSLQFDVNQNGQWPAVPRDAYWKLGSGGFAIFVVPSLDLVVYKLGGRDEQYDPANTGLAPLPQEVFRYDGSREGWKRTVEDSGPSEDERTLELVLRSLIQ